MDGDKMQSFLFLYIFAALVLVSYFFVSKERFKLFFPAGLCVGLASELFAIIVFSKIFPLFTYIHLGKFGEEGFPVFILLGWIVLIILYLHFLPVKDSLWPVLVYTLFFTILTHYLHELIDIENMVHHFKYFDYLAIAGNFIRYYVAYWVNKSGFFYS